jgi:hypothetical protein
MRITIQPRSLNQEWRLWYAWYPVSCEMSNGTNAIVFLETVERKEIHGYGGPDWRYREYLGVKT